MVKLLKSKGGKISRAKKHGYKVYCGRECSSEARRFHKTDEQKKLEKRKYDQQYRKNNFDKIKKAKSAYEKTPAGRAMQKRNREKFKKHHLEYCRQPWYKKWKREYDQKHVAKKKYGEYAEVALMNKALMKEIDNRQAKADNNLINKTQKRKQLCKTARKPSKKR